MKWTVQTISDNKVVTTTAAVAGIITIVEPTCFIATTTTYLAKSLVMWYGIKLGRDLVEPCLPKKI